MTQKKRLVILGGGFAALQVVKRVSLALYDVTLISPRDHFLFTPLLASSTVGTVELRSITEPLLGFRAGVSVVCAEATEINPLERYVAIRQGSTPSAAHTSEAETPREGRIPFDTLVIAVGARIETFGIPGAETVALPLKESSDARKLRTRIVHQFQKAILPTVTSEERKRLLSFVIVGAGPTGVEFAGELSDLVRRELRKISAEAASDVTITLIEAGSDILSIFNQALRRYTHRVLAKQGITVRTGAFVQEVREDCIVLKGGEEVPAGITVWSAGIRATDLVKRSPFELDRRGRIVVNSRLQVMYHNDIFALGDCSFIPGKEYATTAQVAQQQGKYLGKALNTWARGETPAPFWYLHQGMLAYIGAGKGLAETPLGSGLRGWIAWIMWRSVYLTKLVSIRNKVLVLFDWAKARIFGRELSTFEGAR